MVNPVADEGSTDDSEPADIYDDIDIQFDIVSDYIKEVRAVKEKLNNKISKVKENGEGIINKIKSKKEKLNRKRKTATFNRKFDKVIFILGALGI